MNYLRLVVFLVLTCLAAHGQEIPNGVRYKKASDKINDLAKSSLEKALVSDELPTNLFDNVTVLGPMLWKSLKPSADRILVDMMPVIVVVPGSQPISAEGKRIRSDDQRKVFWKLLRSIFPGLKEGKLRKGNAEEISYYWATIPFDIEEPFWVIDSGSDRFIAHFSLTNGQPRLFWIDLVGELRTLRP